jgi:hypothetical protein
MTEVGARVGAILGADRRTNIVEFLGYGVYNGDQPCPAINNFDNPQITLDSGEVTWGCECWWGPEDQIKTKLENYSKMGYTIVEVSIETKRREARGESVQ